MPLIGSKLAACILPLWDIIHSGDILYGIKFPMLFLLRSFLTIEVEQVVIHLKSKQIYWINFGIKGIT